MVATGVDPVLGPRVAAGVVVASGDHTRTVAGPADRSRARLIGVQLESQPVSGTLEFGPMVNDPSTFPITMAVAAVTGSAP